ncbi:conserved hypothetical protein [Acaryochloris marina MBIC11017]|uniref:Phytanoyl-CoA dioxygenase n=1 Tax=Acaryochloris marina (strain MBIC 11017) TaxID=329726 RepID=B0C3Y9_ACAM1|nr:conserved hypothetical protein [Acaryochloris marina MBIC11017]BDM81077.1 hypothetical protein AM10699_39440 [Acaryochloris marina MBIC10699]
MRTYIKNIYFRTFKALKYGTRDPFWLLMYVFSRFFVVRQVFKKLSPKPDLVKFKFQDSIFAELDIEEAVNSLNKDGYFGGLQLPIEILNELLVFGKSALTYGNGNLKNGFIYADKKKAEKMVGQYFSFGSFFNLDEDLPLVRKLGSDPKLMIIAAKYFESEPVHCSTRMWWNFATEHDNFDVVNTSSFYHYDKDDFSCLRVFFYLTDVDSQSGPHVCILGSHREKNLAQILSLKERSDQEMSDIYGEKRFLTVMGIAGSGFIEDPFCFHKGTRPKDKDRLILTLCFAASRYKVLNSRANRRFLKKLVIS